MRLAGWEGCLVGLVAFAGCSGSLKVSVTPKALDFGSVPVGTTATRTVVLSSDDDHELNVQIYPSDGLDGDFAVIPPSVPSIPARGTLSLSVTFHAVFAGPTSGSFQVSVAHGATCSYGTSAADCVTTEVTLAGTGVNPIPACSPSVADGGYTGSSMGTQFGNTVSLWSQAGWQCSPLTGTTPSGTPCSQAEECASYCCPCSRSCAQFQAATCLAEGCAPREVACALLQLYPMLCPPDGTDAGPGNALSGALAFQVASSGVTYLQGSGGGPDMSSVTIELSRDALPIFCPGADGGAYEVSIHLRGLSGPIAAGAYPVGLFPSFNCSVALIDTDGGNLPATAGTVVLTALTATSAEGAFSARLTLPQGGGTSEVSGTFAAPFCGYTP
jgi:Abnormal spindle-like microcephaly-assoc'd, ASPM-SPD-2-Hydin